MSQSIVAAVRKAAMQKAAVAMCFAALAALAGCAPNDGPSLEPAGGTVTYKNAPVKGATVTFIYGNGDVSNGATGDDGKFKITTGGREGAIIGKAKVLVTKVAGGAADMPAQPTWQDMANQAAKQGANMKGAEKPKAELPQKYSDPTQTDLNVDVQAGADNMSFVFDLKD